MWAVKFLNQDSIKILKDRVEQLNQLNELSFKAYESSALKKKKIKKMADKEIRIAEM